MSNLPNTLHTLRPFIPVPNCWYYSLQALEESADLSLRRLPISIRIMLESLLRNCDGEKVKEEDIWRLSHWGKAQGQVPFIVSRVLLQDFTGVPLLVDLAAMRDAAAHLGYNPESIEPKVPVDLVIDHSVQVDRAGTADAFLFNLQLEFSRNKERYSFLKWGQEAFQTFKVVPPGIGIVHQVNLEYLASVVMESKTLIYPDTLVGTDSHTTMINGLGVVGWGVGGIEAEAAMLGQPVTIEMPDVIGVHMTGLLREGVTATDLALHVTQLLRKHHVVDKFVEFFGEGAKTLSVADRATIANMSPEYGATMGFFPVDEKTLEYLHLTGRSQEQIEHVRTYLSAQNLFGIPGDGEIDYTEVIHLDLSTIMPAVSGPKRPQDRIHLVDLKETFQNLLKTDTDHGGYNKTKPLSPIYVHATGEFSPTKHHDSGGQENTQAGASWSESEMVTNRPFTHPTIHPGYSEEHLCDGFLTHGSVVIAAITSCTNTSNPAVMIGAGLLAKKAVEKGLKVRSTVKTSLAPGSRVVTEYLKTAGLDQYLDALGFQLVGYGCTTCIGNSGPLDEKIEQAIKDHDIIVASVLSGNRNFEARIHSAVKANFLMSPQLVVAFALAGRVDIDMEKEPIGYTPSGSPVFLKDIWPSSEEIHKEISRCVRPKIFLDRYAKVLEDNPLWKEIPSTFGAQYKWDKTSTYIQHPPYFKDFTKTPQEIPSLNNMRCIALLGDSITTDHISPAGAFKETSPAGSYLLSLGIKPEDFNSYGSRRGNHHVMMRGSFANVRIKNFMAGGKEGGFTVIYPENKPSSIFDACMHYQKSNIPLILFAGKDYGMGSSRDWAAKGTKLLGIRVVVAESFERIHRSNLIGMGVLPLQFPEGINYTTLGIQGDEVFTVHQANQQEVILDITYASGKKVSTALLCRLDTEMERTYYQEGGILPYVLRRILKQPPLL